MTTPASPKQNHSTETGTDPDRRHFLNLTARGATGAALLATAPWASAVSPAKSATHSKGSSMSTTTLHSSVAPSPRASFHSVDADGVRVLYREAGPANAPVILLLHGFPASSHMFRELIPRLATRYRVIAPDLPGFGFTAVPEARHYTYSFDSLARTTEAFVEALGIKRYALYVFDYGAPVGFRLALAHPDRVTAIVSQNGNAYEEGLGEAWAPFRQYWAAPNPENRKALLAALTLETTHWAYTHGLPNPSVVAPEAYHLDAALMARPGNAEIQLDLFLDYASNLKRYPAFQAYFREAKPRLLAIWGKYDQLFIPAGAQAFKRDNPNAVVKLLEASHFALETHVDEIAAEMHGFLRN
jgi:pimeloyl-ACP methyl ester carboxylesterase